MPVLYLSMGFDGTWPVYLLEFGRASDVGLNAMEFALLVSMLHVVLIDMWIMPLLLLLQVLVLTRTLWWLLHAPMSVPLTRWWDGSVPAAVQR